MEVKYENPAVLPAGENVRVTRERPDVPKRKMLRFSVLPLTMVAAMDKSFNHSMRYTEYLATIRRAGIGIIAGVIVGMDNDDPRVFEKTLAFLKKAKIDAVQLNILTPLPGTPLLADMERAGRIQDRDRSHYDFRHVVFRPALMTGDELQAGADWVYDRFYSLNEILLRFIRNMLTFQWMPALPGLRLGLTYRYDNKRENTRGWNPMKIRPAYTVKGGWDAYDYAQE